MANTHKVLRTFTGGGQVRNPGDLVDGSEFGSLSALVDQRYLESVGTSEPMIGGAGPSPDPKLLQEEQANKNRKAGTGDEGGEIAGLPETLGDTAKGEDSNDGSVVQLKGKLPEDFPGRLALETEGITTYAQTRKRLGDLRDIPGIGEATAEKIRAIFGDSTDEDEE